MMIGTVYNHLACVRPTATCSLPFSSGLFTLHACALAETHDPPCDQHDAQVMPPIGTASIPWGHAPGGRSGNRTVTALISGRRCTYPEHRGSTPATVDCITIVTVSGRQPTKKEGNRVPFAASPMPFQLGLSAAWVTECRSRQRCKTRPAELCMN